MSTNNSSMANEMGAGITDRMSNFDH
ncbi:MAG: hypothetical protein RL609_860, partial [Bacteroidota bacterium]